MHTSNGLANNIMQYPSDANKKGSSSVAMVDAMVDAMDEKPRQYGRSIGLHRMKAFCFFVPWHASILGTGPRDKGKAMIRTSTNSYGLQALPPPIKNQSYCLHYELQNGYDWPKVSLLLLTQI